LTCVSKNSLH